MRVVHQNLCQALRFTAIERISGIKVSYPLDVSHTHLNWHVMLWISLIFD